MTKDPRTLRALLSARSRMRDIAAADHATKTTACTTAADAIGAQTAVLDHLLDDAHAVLGRAASIYDLDLVANDVSTQRAMIARARQDHVEALAIADLAASALRARTRQLKTAERIVELARDERAATESRAEQRGTDDLVAARGAR